MSNKTAPTQPATATPPPENLSFLPAGSPPLRDPDFPSLEREGGRYEDTGFGALR